MVDGQPERSAATLVVPMMQGDNVLRSLVAFAIALADEQNDDLAAAMLSQALDVIPDREEARSSAAWRA
ncbi:hypothetical protein [Sphingomonas sp. ACRSK]|uniref:hypothetical protein n=1 Tax=Sphingomonas sp. ACRSK TaxID=2918213 RepID=UPI001EF6EEA6|nr:hypothetical protein [Sphingomonas sp. ACRSK]MCG7349393.1 hypothetical protein [Sphingomonas sp. ACRSK]